MTLTKSQWKIDQAERKAELKSLTKELKAIKPAVKQAQRDCHSKLEEYNLQFAPKTTRSADGKTRIFNNDMITFIRSEYIKKLHEMWKLQGQMLSMRQKFRGRHIIYCLYNGTKLEDIEQKTNKWDNPITLHGFQDEVRMAQYQQRLYEEKKEERRKEVKENKEYDKGLFFECGMLY